MQDEDLDGPSKHVEHLRWHRELVEPAVREFLGKCLDAATAQANAAQPAPGLMVELPEDLGPRGGGNYGWMNNRAWGRWSFQAAL